MKNLLIIGARGFGREVYNTATESIGYGTEFLIKGFLDDKSEALDGYDGYPPIIDSVEHYNPQSDDVFICALGEVKFKKKYIEMILQKGGTFINIIHKSTYIGKNTTIGKGCIFSREDQISCDVKIGDFVTMNHLVIIGHDAVIGDYAHFNCKSFMGGFSSIGRCSTMQTSSFLAPYKRIGDNAVVGAGSYAFKNVKDNTSVFGNPAQEFSF